MFLNKLRSAKRVASGEVAMFVNKCESVAACDSAVQWECVEFRDLQRKHSRTNWRGTNKECSVT